MAVAVEELKQGNKFTVDGGEIEAVTDVPAGHKVALCDMEEKTPVIKYGCPIDILQPGGEGRMDTHP